MHDSRFNEQAARLLQAEQTRIPTVPFSAPLTFSEAYRLQDHCLERKCQAGCTLRGYKVGLTSQVLQQALGADEPIYGILTNTMLYASGCTFSSAFIKPKLEVELAFVLARSLNTPLHGSTFTLFDVLDATLFIVPALELVDSRLVSPKDTQLGLPDIVSDNASSAGVVLGVSPFSPTSCDLNWISAICRRNGIIEGTGVSAAVLDHPGMSVAWLANSLAKQGKHLESGHIILSGAFIAPVEARAGDTFHVEYHSHGSVSCSFRA